MNESRFWTKRDTTAQTYNIDAVDGFNSLTIFVTTGGSVATSISGTLELDGVAGGRVNINTGETITLDAADGKVLDGIEIITSSDSTTYIIARQ